MKLRKVHVREFQSIIDSTEFEIDDVTCLVGKNEAGKTALLKALYRLMPVIEEDGSFDVIDDYPRRSVTDYEEEVSAGQRDHSIVVRATYSLDSEDITAVEEIFGPECLLDKNPTVALNRGYSNTNCIDNLNINEEATLRHLVEAAGLSRQLTNQLLKLKTAEEMIKIIAASEQTNGSIELSRILGEIVENGFRNSVYDKILIERIPDFLYFDEYYQMKGQDNLDALKQRVATNQLEDSDRPLLGLIELARLNLNELTDPRRTEALINKLEAAENQLTMKVLKYWSQNQHLRMKFDIRPAQPEDPLEMRSGINIWGRVHDTKHMVSTPFGTRSRGFIWFFSFLAWYSKLRREGKNMILLLDEPGLSLHAKAQGDLLRFFEEELMPNHQLIYTTHSPFMVDPEHLSRVRIVQDLSIESDSERLPEEQQGTRVLSEVLDATPDSLFPLQGALGYDIYQTLFIGPNSLVVEGVSDMLYLKTISSLLQQKGEAGLSPEWTITPVGGSSKVATFVAMIGAQKHLKVAILIDYQKKEQQSIENIYKKKLLEKKKVLTYADFFSGEEADIEDMFNPGFYLKLVNGEYGSSFAASELPAEPTRILVRLEKLLKEKPLPQSAKFNHFRPARYFTEKIKSLEGDLSGRQLDRFRKIFDAVNALL